MNYLVAWLIIGFGFWLLSKGFWGELNNTSTAKTLIEQMGFSAEEGLFDPNKWPDDPGERTSLFACFNMISNIGGFHFIWMGLGVRFPQHLPASGRNRLPCRRKAGP